MKAKRRLSASVDDDLIRAAEAAAKRGDVPTVSAWVNEALREKLDHERRLASLGSFIRGFEGANGEISEREMDDAARRARGRAVTVRALAPTPRNLRARRRAG